MRLNDFLLHMLYKDNWENEIKEDYLFWSMLDYIDMCYAIGYSLPIVQDVYLLDYVKEKWLNMHIPENLLSEMYSTGLLAFVKDSNE
jgi:hypothetical protein